jgi:hypothetical protein
MDGGREEGAFILVLPSSVRRKPLPATTPASNSPTTGMTKERRTTILYGGTNLVPRCFLKTPMILISFDRLLIAGG